MHTCTHAHMHTCWVAFALVAHACQHQPVCSSSLSLSLSLCVCVCVCVRVLRTDPVPAGPRTAGRPRTRHLARKFKLNLKRTTGISPSALALAANARLSPSSLLFSLFRCLSLPLSLSLLSLSLSLLSLSPLFCRSLSFCLSLSPHLPLCLSFSLPPPSLFLLLKGQRSDQETDAPNVFCWCLIHALGQVRQCRVKCDEQSDDVAFDNKLQRIGVCVCTPHRISQS